MLQISEYNINLKLGLLFPLKGRGRPHESKNGYSPPLLQIGTINQNF